MSPRVAFLALLLLGCGPNGPGTIGAPPCPCCSLTCFMLTCGWDCSGCGKDGCKDAGHIAAAKVPR